MDWFDLSGMVWCSPVHDIYIARDDLTIREITSDPDDPVVAGPFDSLDAAKAAYLVMVS